MEYELEAKRYVRARLDAELGLAAMVEHILDKYARIIVNLAYQYNIPPKQFSFKRNKKLRELVESYIRDMIREIWDYIFEYSSQARKDTDSNDVLAYLHDSGYYDTLRTRLDLYGDMWKREMEKNIAAGMIAGISPLVLLRTYDPKRPYDAAYYKEAEEIGSGVLALRDHNKRGVGKTISGLTAFIIISRYTLSNFWMNDYYKENEKRGEIEGYYVMRGSSYPCDLCDSMVGFHKDSIDLPPYHPRCCCIAIPKYKEK